jgi:hypothetical protein
MRFQRLFMAVIGMTILSASQWAQEPSAATPQVAFTYATHRDSANGHFVVDITSTSNVIIRCQIQYSGHSFLDTDRSSRRTMLIRPVGKDGKPVVASPQFEGFRTFKATVNCAAK